MSTFGLSGCRVKPRGKTPSCPPSGPTRLGLFSGFGPTIRASLLLLLLCENTPLPLLIFQNVCTVVFCAVFVFFAVA